MIVVPINPVLVSFGPLAVRWGGVLALIGLGLAVWLSLRQLGRGNLPREVALDALAWALPVALVFGRLVYVLGWWEFFFTHPSVVWQFNVDGISLWGALLSGGLVARARLGLRRDQLQRRQILDAVVPYVALGIAVGRLGAFLDGYGQGLPSALPWATQYTNPLAATPDFGVPRHPVQAYEALVALALFFGVSRLPQTWPAGSRLTVFLTLLGVAWVGLGSVRLAQPFLLGLQIEQLLALVGAVVGLGCVVTQVVKMSRTRSPTEPRRKAGLAEDQIAA